MTWLLGPLYVLIIKEMGPLKQAGDPAHCQIRTPASLEIPEGHIAGLQNLPNMSDAARKYSRLKVSFILAFPHQSSAC